MLLGGITGDAQRATRADELDVDVAIVMVFAVPGIGDLIAVPREGRIKFLSGRARERDDIRITSESRIPMGVEPRAASDDDQDGKRADAPGQRCSSHGSSICERQRGSELPHRVEAVGRGLGKSARGGEFDR